MSSVMKTLLVNPPSFEKFDGGAGSRWQAAREAEAYWYPTWLSYAAGMLPGSRLLDAPPHHITPEQTVTIAAGYEFVVVFTSTVGFESDLRLARRMKEAKPDLKIAFVGPPVQVQPAESLAAGVDIDFVVRGEFDHAVVDLAQGRPIGEIPGVSYRQDGRRDGAIVHNPAPAPLGTAELDRLPFATEVYKRDLAIERYNMPFLQYPYVSFYTSRGCPALCTFCLWPQTLSGHAWRVRSVDNVVAEVRQALKLFPQAKEFFFDDDTFNIRKDRVLELCRKFKPLGFRWSCNCRVHSDYDTLKSMADAGARKFVVGFESGDPQILKNIMKGTNIEKARAFARNCKKVGILIHGDFIIGLPGETPQSIERTIEFAKELDTETIQVSIAHALPGTDLYNYARTNNLMTSDAVTDSGGHQLPHLEYPGLSRQQMMAAVNRFYDSYYFRPRVIWRIVRNGIWDATERKRLYNEGVEFLKLRAERWRYARKAPAASMFLTAPAGPPSSGAAPNG